MKLLGLVASSRPGSLNRALFDHVAQHLKDSGHGVEEIDYTIVENLPLYSALREQAPGIPEDVRTIATRLRDADGIVIASPEYNFSLPGPLKNAIDWVSRIKPYATIGKPVLLMSASGSPVGGWRGLAALRIPLACLGARVMPWEIVAGNVTSAEGIRALARTEAFSQRVEQAVAQLS